MANRKVLINRHTSGNAAPIAADMYKGEIAVQHKTGEEILWTKNNDDVMVPFISCAQTIAIIDSMVQASEDVVKTKDGEVHLKVESAGTSDATEWILSSEDVQSKEAFDAYSARTNSALSALTDAFYSLLDITVTGINGDSIITATKVGEDSGSNAYNLTHKQALATNGFNKLTTDDYGHVTAAAPVAASDIKALGFEDSAWTAEAITDAIAALDSAISASTTGKYLTAISIKDGKLDKMEEADIPVLSVESTGSGNVVSQITVADHKISYTTTSVATSEDIQKLSAATESFSAATDAKFTELSAYTKDVDNKVEALSAGTIQLSADTVAYVNQLSGYVHGEIVELSGVTVSAFTAILGMDKTADAVAGQVVTTVSEVDGVVSETKANVKDLQLGGYSKDTTATGDIASTDTINAALSKLENKAAAISINNADGSINVTPSTAGTDINVNIKSGEKVLAKDGSAGLYTDLDLVKITTGLPETVKERYQLLATDDSQIGVTIDVPKDSHIVSINYLTTGEHAQNLEYVYIDAFGQTQTTYVDMTELVLETEFASGVTVTNHIAHGVVDPASEKDSNNDSFLTVGADGFKVDGIKDEIDAKIAALDVTDTAVAGQYISSVSETDGKVSMTRANVSSAVLNNYAKGTDATAVAATDTVNEAISKLENQIDKAKDAATTKVVEGTDDGNNMTITSTSGADGSVTYTVNLTDVASKTALDAEIAARKAVDGQAGQTYAANAGTNFISDAASLNDADVKLDAAINELSSNTIAAIEALDSSSAATDSGHYITAITITNGKISAVADEAIPAKVAITATTTTPVDTVSAVLTGVTANGTDNHNLTFGTSNKVFSASTADEAVKVKSALTINILTSAGTTASTSTFDGHDNVVVDIPGSHDTATTEDGHYTPSTTASSLDAAAGTVLNKVTLDSKNHVISAGTTDKINSASTAESADTATKVDNALTVSGYSTSSASSLDFAIAYDGSAAKSLTFGTVGNAGLSSMSMTSAGVVDVEVIDCGEY